MKVHIRKPRTNEVYCGAQETGHPLEFQMTRRRANATCATCRKVQGKAIAERLNNERNSPTVQQ